MIKKDLQLPVIKYSDVPFYEITAPMRFYFPICDENPYAAYLLDYCFSLRAISLFAYQQKLDQEEMRLAGMSPEDREAEVERMWRDSLNKEEMRQTRVYEGEDSLNDEDDAKEGANGFFDLNLGEKQTLYALRGETPLEHLRQHFEEAYRLLKKKGFLVSAGEREQLAWWAVDGALEACYPDLYKQQEHEAEQKRKRESTKVQHHVNSAKRLGLPATLTLPEWIETLSYFEWKCAYCCKASYTVLEHVQPIIAGGGTTAFNCVPACVRCNLLKHDIPPELLPPGFDGALERIQQYLKEKKLRYLQNSENEH